jgi:hypothetical protein
MTEQAKCEICGEPMPAGEEVFKFHGYSGPCPKPPLPRPETELERLKKIEARYDWLMSKVITRGETCLALYEEFGGAPIKGETMRQFVDRYIDAALTANATVSRPREAGPETPPPAEGRPVE